VARTSADFKIYELDGKPEKPGASVTARQGAAEVPETRAVMKMQGDGSWLSRGGGNNISLARGFLPFTHACI